jgi:biuret amidohydrolase
MKKPVRRLIEGKPVLVIIDIQKGSFAPIPAGVRNWRMPGFVEAMSRVPALIQVARRNNVPVVFVQEAHRPNLVDFGRELDGVEGVHCLESDPGTPVADEVGMRPDDYFIRKRRYSVFFGTEFEILLKGLGASTLLLVGGFTDVCVHYTFVDAHQHDYFCRVVEDCVGGSSLEAHEYSLRAMEYLQTGARRQSKEVIDALNAWGAESSRRDSGIVSAATVS